MKRRIRPKTVEKYGEVWDVFGNDDDARIELGAVAQMGTWKGKQGQPCGKGLFYHVRAFQKLAFPDKYWHRWNEGLILPELCKTGRLALFGPSSTGKSLEFSAFALSMFYARPIATTVIISSTTLDALRRRIWDYVVQLHKSAKKVFPWLAGHLIESKNMLLAQPATEDFRSLKSGILGVACKRGGQWQGLEEYIGTKAGDLSEEQSGVFILGADEVMAVPMGIIDSLANLESNPICFAAFMGNLPDIHNPLAKAAEPKLGWESLPDTKVSRVYETRWYNGRAVQLIGYDSPNLDFPEGHEPYKNLIGRRYIDQCRHNYGEQSDRFNMFAVGQIPKSTADRRVFSKSDCYKFNAFDPVTWSHEKLVKGYMLDVAYSGTGGDRTAGAPFILGKDATHNWRFWCGPIRVYQGSEIANVSHAEAIVRQCKADCEQAGIPPAHVFFDGTGRSEFMKAFADIGWTQVVPIQFGGPASDRECFTGQKHLVGDNQGERMTCREAYDRFVTELWFALAHCIRSDQMRGMSEEAADEACQRRWDEARGGRQSVETKDEMRKRTSRSPDLGDMLVAGIEGARRLGFPLGQTPQVKRKRDMWIRHLQDKEQEQRKEELLTA